MPHELPKAYEPGAIEKRWAEYWVNEKLFHVAAPAKDDTTPTFTILLPPPNVTGALHMGHMLEHTETDMIVRWRRMKGERTLWLPGTDHAGIATQMLVERQLASEGISRRQLGREGFLQRVWKWREHYGGTILAQMKRLGASVDWDREYFTMDERLSRAVREVFVRLYEEGLIYRGKYIVNWCPRCVTAISDLEVVHEETPGHLWQIKYPVLGGHGEFVTVATTRPETMLGDTAVAVNADDKRYTHLHGKKVILPLMNREIPIILDPVANPEFGTGAVKVTPAHDPNDFEAGLRHDLPQIVVMDEVGRMNENAGKYAGLDRYEARERIVHDLDAQGLLAGTKDYVVPLGKCQRCKTIVEPRLSTQWFVAINKEPANGGLTMAGAATDAVTKDYIRFTPENYKTIFLQWMENLHDWCISRQLWWGHRIPAWHCAECGKITVAKQTPVKCACGSDKLEQDPDVLDTWFSSALLPFTALGWPDDTPDLRAFYPNTLMLNGFDILFFWDARMVMMGCHFMMPPHRPQPSAVSPQPSVDQLLAESVPFRDVYIHALVRDAERQKMSKTKGNVMDPVEVVERYGTDATRFTLASMAAPGTDIAFSESRTEGYRAFANKIWNAARFMFMNVDRIKPSAIAARPSAEPGVAGFEPVALEDRWILSRFNRVAKEVDESLATYRFHEAAHVIYDFFWGEFCDWYLELIKPRLSANGRGQDALATAGKDAGATADGAVRNLVALFEAALRLLSPIMPFISEEIWHTIYEGRPPAKSIALAPYPRASERQMDTQAETEMAILQDLIVSVRNIRAELKVEPRAAVPVQVHASTDVRRIIEENRGAVERQANVEQVAFVDASLAKMPGARTTARFEVRVLYEKKVDVAAERERLSKELAKIEKDMENAQRQLGNEGFLSKAPAHVVEGLKKRAGELAMLREKTRGALAELS